MVLTITSWKKSGLCKPLEPSLLSNCRFQLALATTEFVAMAGTGAPVVAGGTGGAV